MESLKKCFNFFAERWAVIAGTAVVCLLGVVVLIKGEQYFSSNDFCSKCHSMSWNFKELEASSHFGALGVNPRCQDCHLPPNFIKRLWVHAYDGTRALIGELKHDLSTEEKFNEHRPEYAHNARISLKKWDSITCRQCHKDPKPGAEAKKEHEKMKTEGATCIDCHQNLVHKEVPEEDLNEGLKQGKIVLKPEPKEEEEAEEPAEEEKPADEAAEAKPEEKK